MAQDTDLVVVEFTFNEMGNLQYTTPQRRGFEQLLRKLASLPGAPAVLVLHHYAWWHAGGDGVKRGLYYRQAEQQLTTMAQYYDMPAPSVRAAVWHLMRADVAPFKVRCRSAAWRRWGGAAAPVLGRQQAAGHQPPADAAASCCDLGAAASCCELGARGVGL